MTKQEEVYQAEHKILKQAYDKAIKDKKLIFEIEGASYLVAYAKYRIEYLETLFNPAPKEAKRKK
jgi:mRNA-degrading endonuclease HigB of HigAB toxin-antitoxin module